MVETTGLVYFHVHSAVGVQSAGGVFSWRCIQLVVYVDGWMHAHGSMWLCLDPRGILGCVIIACGLSRVDGWIP